MLDTPSDLTEAEAADALLAAIADDLDTGFAELVRTYERVVFSVALRVSGQTSEAEDLSAEAFLRAYRALRGFDRSRIQALRPRSWLLTIVLNTWRNSMRGASRRPMEMSDVDLPTLPARGLSVEEHVERDETSRELAELVARLPERQRAAVVLRHIVGLSVSEIAEVLRVPEGTVKSHVSRGLRRLRELYVGEESAGDTPAGLPGKEH
ncbi:MAG: sigma-70 family RNA polymerase sigma factor [Actinomycetota bacterium]|nr:sigma-70 family RNA polymerase sigma factor [Actinomycetota bacterium]